ncbi:uncharacterized protein LOC126980362 [Eriocheir sinensis]|uniref:uncharacterized protein LOC126980362 n=1 Tax=Eriocheir sinensis TaxID=95602 RepID=UPI0021C5FCD4|nr:uncharacterized protein LOC126980362 [Eriocheir sinensis]XP_050686149.1 uncharacterized protein LOC126980362 [Eriocheir sinensis]XP_050686151.1 uncharacterized protein LOC126980362 [Eriocheir sinensis]
MPVYKGVLSLEDEGPETPTVHLFDYSAEEDQGKPKSSYRKQLIALESCIFLGRRTVATLKSQSEARSKNQSGKSTQNGTPEATNGNTEEKETNGEVKEAEQEVKKEEKKVYLKEGQEFQAYVLKCPNGPYDYATKLWDKGRAAPSEEGYPKEGQEVAAVVVDRAGDLLTVACGTNIAFARRKTFLCAGVDPDDLSLPFARLMVSLRRPEEREAQVPAAAWEALPTQVVVPHDVY